MAWPASLRPPAVAEQAADGLVVALSAVPAAVARAEVDEPPVGRPAAEPVP
jgi:hypothetical protein